MPAPAPRPAGKTESVRAGPGQVRAARSASAALAFSAPTVGGGTLDLSAYAGKNVAFWFWAPY